MTPTAQGTSLLVVITDLDSGGTERQLLAVLPKLRQRGLDIGICVLTHAGTMAQQFTAAGISVHEPVGAAWLGRLPSRLARPLLHLASALTLLRLLYRRRPEILHFILPPAYLVGGLASLAAPPGIRVMSRRSLNLYQRRYPLLARLEHRLHRRMQAIIGNAQAVLADLRAEGVPAARLHLIRNGIDVSRFAGVDRAVVRAGLGIGGDALVLIVVANLIPYKGHADLLAALAQVQDRLPRDWQLLCVGHDTGRIGPALQQRALRDGIAGHLHWLGSRDDVPQLLAAADVALLCSHEEGFPNAILEAMAAGLPVIATRVGGSAEAVLDGETGILVPPREPRLLGDAIAALAGDATRRSAYGRAGRRRVEREFALERAVDAYDRLYRDLLARHRPMPAK
ncbi:MAG TPA: glycosyltransferase [Candidatus Sulfotelmatobacter sp.]|nr:glycosyltransferase [Candidatus Sulfotelmatobacter sp.]